MKIEFPKLSSQEIQERLNVPAGRIRLVMDCDAKNEVDDQYAISWALRSPERFDVEAVYAAPFSHGCLMKLTAGDTGLMDSVGVAELSDPSGGMEASYQELFKLFELLDENPEGRIYRGSSKYITDNNGPVDSPAARDLIKRAMSSDEILYVATTGAPTNIASALMMEPELVKKIVVVWLGGEALDFPHGLEFNLIQDIEASRILLDSGVPLVMVPVMNVVSMLTLSKPEIQSYMLGKSRISDYLAKITLESVSDYQAEVQSAIGMAMGMSMTYLRQREDRGMDYLSQFSSSQAAWSRIICDIATVAFLKNPNWALSTLQPSPILNDDFSWAPRDDSRHPIRVVNFCTRDLILGDMLACLNR